MFKDLFENAVKYDPDTIDPAIREKMSKILSHRAKILEASVEVVKMRSKIWAGDKSVEDIAEIKTADLLKLKREHMELMHELLGGAIDMESLTELVPMIIGGVLQSVKVPLPVLVEVMGIDSIQVKMIAEKLKGLFENL